MMKGGSLLNADIIEVISKMGHTDEIAIGDAGLPIPEGVKRIDLALKEGIPGFIEVLETLLETFECEGYVLAEEIQTMNPDVADKVEALLGDVRVEYVPHELFKEKTKKVKAVIRTGECSPYANVILKSGVIF
jgi:D-ribose pyranase